MVENKKDHLPARSTDSMNRDKWGQEMVFAYLVYTIFSEKMQGIFLAEEIKIAEKMLKLICSHSIILVKLITSRNLNE